MAGFLFRAPFAKADRERLLQNFSSSPTIYDLCIIGGGITGAAIARDASLRGLKVLLLEKDDFAQGTSSRSSKLIHGGVRYLEYYEFKLVMESTRERARLWKLAPHLVSPLPFLFPAYGRARVPLWKLDIGLWLYDILALFRLPTRHRLWFKKKTLEQEPGLNPQDLNGAIFYWDGATDDAKLTLANIADAVATGAHCLSRSRVTDVEWSAQSAYAGGHRIHFTDTLSAMPHVAQARVVVAAAGPWTDELLPLIKAPLQRKTLAPTRGSHIVVSAERLPLKHAVTLFHPRDERVLFSIPWGEASIVGTTDLFDDKSPDRTQMTPTEVDYLIEAANAFFPRAQLKRDDVQSTWTGLRPLMAPPDDAAASAISREHLIKFYSPGFLVIAGGKLTTHRAMAEEAVDAIVEGCQTWAYPLRGDKHNSHPTEDRPLPDFAYPQRDAPREKQNLGASEAARLSLDDVRGILRTQMVLSLEDFMVRRTMLYYKEKQNGWALLAQLKDIFCAELGWSEGEWQSQVDAYRQYLMHTVYEPLEKPFPHVG